MVHTMTTQPIFQAPESWRDLPWTQPCTDLLLPQLIGDTPDCWYIDINDIPRENCYESPKILQKGTAQIHQNFASKVRTRNAFHGFPTWSVVSNVNSPHFCTFQPWLEDHGGWRLMHPKWYKYPVLCYPLVISGVTTENPSFLDDFPIILFISIHLGRGSHIYLEMFQYVVGFQHNMLGATMCHLTQWDALPSTNTELLYTFVVIPMKQAQFFSDMMLSPSEGLLDMGYIALREFDLRIKAIWRTMLASSESDSREVVGSCILYIIYIHIIIYTVLYIYRSFLWWDLMRWINIERLFDDSPPNGNCSDHQNGLKKKATTKATWQWTSWVLIFDELRVWVCEISVFVDSRKHIGRPPSKPLPMMPVPMPAHASSQPESGPLKTSPKKMIEQICVSAHQVNIWCNQTKWE